MKNNLILLALLFIVSCTEYNDIKFSESDLTLQTKSSENETYYWYRGEKIPLTVNLKYVNIILPDSSRNDSKIRKAIGNLSVNADIENHSNYIKVKFKNQVRGIQDYYAQIEEIKNNLNVSGVYPYFEQGNGLEPIGTSDIFYVRLKEVKDEELTTEKKTYDLTALSEFSKKHGVKIIKEVQYMPDWYVLSAFGSDFKSSIEATNCFYESGLFADVDPAFMFKVKKNATNDPYFSQQWGLKNTSFEGYDINVEGAWNITRGNGVKIAIIDSGVDDTHSDLYPNFTSISFDAESNTSPSVYNSNENHGTIVAGVMTAKGNNNLFIAGVAYEAKLMRISFDYNTNENITEKLSKAINWAWNNGADIINCSWGLIGPSSTLIESAINNALTYGRSNKGTIVVFAAGNREPNILNMYYPGTSDDRIITVGSMNNIGYRYSGSCYGEKLDIIAPGNSIYSTGNGNSIDHATGTSVAAPHVSGVAALILSANPNLTREEVVRIIERTAKKVNPEIYPYYQYYNRPNGTWNEEVGYGLVDATKAVTVAYNLGLTPPNSSPRLDYYIMTGAAAQYDDWFVMGNNQNATAYFSVKSAYINSQYSYYWQIKTSGDSTWNPSYTYNGNQSGINVSIPRPNMDSVITVTCDIFEGSTHICTAIMPLTVRLNFP